MDMIHIDRSKRTEAWNRVAEQGRRFMAQGNWVIMFPEGTRTPRGGQGTYKSGGTRLAVATGAAGAAGRGDLGALLAAQELHRCGPASSTSRSAGRSRRPAASADELMREVETWIEAEMRRLDPEAYRRRRRRRARSQPCPRRGAAIAPIRRSVAVRRRRIAERCCGARGRPRRLDRPRAARSPRARAAASRIRRPSARSGSASTAIGYALKRARRRSIGFVVGPEGLSVSAPSWVGAARHRGRAAREGRLDPAQAASSSASARGGCGAARVDWRDGTIVPFLGADR